MASEENEDIRAKYEKLAEFLNENKVRLSGFYADGDVFLDFMDDVAETPLVEFSEGKWTVYPQ